MLNVAVLFSSSTRGRAPGLEELLRHPQRGRLYEIECALTPPRDDAETARLLLGRRIDLVLLLGYLRILQQPMLEAFPDRILNVHDADLTLRRRDGGPLYPGLHATRDAILAGERQTRSSIHVVTAEVDAGPVIAVSPSYPVAPFAREAAAAEAMDIVKAYAYAQREWMMRDSWAELVIDGLKNVGPTLQSAPGRLENRPYVSEAVA